MILDFDREAPYFYAASRVASDTVDFALGNRELVVQLNTGLVLCAQAGDDWVMKSDTNLGIIGQDSRFWWALYCILGEAVDAQRIDIRPKFENAVEAV